VSVNLARLVSVCLAFLIALPVSAEHALIAVATNFKTTAEVLIVQYSKERQRLGQAPHDLSLSSGATGKLFAQIVQGAPFDAFLAADQARPQRLIERGLAEADSQQTYALGRLYFVGGNEADLRNARFASLAIANPTLAPYGIAALETLESLGVANTTKTATDFRIARGENIGQTWAMYSLGSADAALVAYTQVLQAKRHGAGGWLIPNTMHDPIRQDAVLLKHGTHNAAARSFLDFLGSDAARYTISKHGYLASNTP